MTTQEMRLSLKALQNNLIDIAGASMLEHKDEIVGFVIHQQETQSVDSLGNPLREYSESYKLHKQREGKSGITDFDETGEMHGSMALAIQGDEYFINSPAQTETGELKSEWLENWQDAPVMDLTPENKDAAYNIIEPTFIEKVEAFIGD